jgi:tripartite-type tricarboxylate transporter receptor subunit TctC
VPIRTPKDIVARLNAATVRTMSDPDMRERLLVEGADPASSTPEEFATFLRTEIEKWAKVINAANIQPE